MRAFAQGLLTLLMVVNEGFSVSRAGGADTAQAVDSPNPYAVKMLAIGNDRIAVADHGIAHRHLDSLAPINHQGVFYNGYKPGPQTPRPCAIHDTLNPLSLAKAIDQR
jgi:hypothetical protein